MTDLAPTLSTFSFPYRHFEPLSHGREQLKAAAARPGTALVWTLGGNTPASAINLVQNRPGGLTLILILPTAPILDQSPDLLSSVTSCRPQAILPAHGEPHPSDVAEALRLPPSDLAAEVTDYLRWRGILADSNLARLVRQMVDLSIEVQTITGLARRLYISRRALGRRLVKHGLPVPSHWLQAARLLRLATRLQNTQTSVFSVAYQAGYPDGFSVSNQMYRLIGYRPSQVRRFLGWEWILEAWLKREAEAGTLVPPADQESMSQARRLPRKPESRRRADKMSA